MSSFKIEHFNIEQLLLHPLPAPLDKSSNGVILAGLREGKKLRHNYFGSEHLILGMVSEGEEDLAGRALLEMGVTFRKVRDAIYHIIGEGNVELDYAQMPFMPRVHGIIDRADYIRRENTLHLGVGTAPVPEIASAHLLLGTSMEGQGMAVGILESLGANSETEHILEVLNKQIR